MLYDRKIKYLDYYENGERVRGSGFLKTELLKNSFQLELTVKGVRCAGEFAGEVILCGAGREEALGKIQLAGGQGAFRYACHIDAEAGGTIGDTNITCSELRGIRIPLGEGREINCIWDGPAPASQPARSVQPVPVSQTVQSASVSQTVQPARSVQPVPVSQTVQSAPASQSARPVQSAPASQPARSVQSAPEPQSFQPVQSAPASQSAPVSQTVQPARSAQSSQLSRRPGEVHAEETNPEAKRQEEAPSGRREASSGEQETVPLMENKWLQLCTIYPHINPFQDQREYLSIGPEDFVLFSSESYKAAGNSFMLHGYYNYRHLILTREERRGETVYYVGVPGNYYDREKQVAIMFGFESFECAQEPAQSSDFGYYMMRVQL